MIFLKINQLDRHVKAIDGIFNLIRELAHEEDLEISESGGCFSHHNSVNGYILADERCMRCQFDKLIAESGIEQSNEQDVGPKIDIQVGDDTEYYVVIVMRVSDKVVVRVAMLTEMPQIRKASGDELEEWDESKLESGLRWRLPR